MKGVSLLGSAALRLPLQRKSTCHRGGIGRRAWFRSMYSQGCGGSSPFDGTNDLWQYEVLLFAQDFASGLPLRSRPLGGSSSSPFDGTNTENC